ncbi:hypothetical protein OG946_13310 [Streptomyces sp. NBC_01808]|uniref:hypothetical protein n=1 Tax=Streptomyces sp. NBC_01808 TaxID=2975947 RepID=UPI002DD8657C|nr:hypothetical protein [Streptomyces sp. NBC_01808]WSA38262.1 hypothetical protein OG946_13310 [Streptomyces sp. NBC_01808]
MTTHARPTGRRTKTVTLNVLAVALAVATAVSCTGSDGDDESGTTGTETTSETTDHPDAEEAPGPQEPETTEDPGAQDDPRAQEGSDTADAADASTAASPGFLEADDLPLDSSGPWTADEVTTGFPEHGGPSWLEETLAEGDVPQRREFRTELDAGATQYTVVQPDESAAADLATRLDEAIERYANEYEEQQPASTAEYRDYGTIHVGDGARVQGLHTRQDHGANDVSLYAVGRDGDTVTVVRWGKMGDFTSAPVADFQDTATTAVDRLR